MHETAWTKLCNWDGYVVSTICNIYNMLVLVTTGGTVPFEALIELVLSQESMSTLSQLGFTKMRIQYGRGNHHIFTKHHKEGVLSITGFEYTDDLAGEMSRAHMVISHAGTGSVLDALRIGKHPVVVVNSKLMDNHQIEIAEELFRKRHLLVSGDTDSVGFIKALKMHQEYLFETLPDPEEGILQRIIDETVSFV